MYEITHLLGYQHHGNKKNDFNDDTVPYKVGSLFEQYLRSLDQQPA